MAPPSNKVNNPVFHLKSSKATTFKWPLF